MQEPTQEDEIYSLYQKELHDQNQIDFNDILNESLKLVKKYPKLMEKYMNIFKFGIF